MARISGDSGTDQRQIMALGWQLRDVQTLASKHQIGRNVTCGVNNIHTRAIRLGFTILHCRPDLIPGTVLHIASHASRSEDGLMATHFCRTTGASRLRPCANRFASSIRKMTVFNVRA
jgi:hypothetical protein